MSALRTLSHIEVMLRIYWSPEAFDIRPDIISDLILEQLICDSPTRRGYCATDRGKVYCEAIRDVPLPVQKWSMP